MMKRKYSLNQLIDKQPRKFKESKDFKLLLSFFMTSEKLKRLRIGRKCYRLLNNSRVSAEKLDFFYRAFELPKNPFFPLFLKIKKEYLLQKKSVKDAKYYYILNKMKKLPVNVKTFIKYLATYEISLNNKKKNPVWDKIIYPKTKKKVDSYFKYSKKEWSVLFFEYLSALKVRYYKYDGKYARKIVSLFIIELPIKKHTQEEIKKQYRKLSKKFHPDLGGDPDDFKLLQQAYKILLD